MRGQEQRLQARVRSNPCVYQCEGVDLCESELRMAESDISRSWQRSTPNSYLHFRELLLQIRVEVVEWRPSRVFVWRTHDIVALRPGHQFSLSIMDLYDSTYGMRTAPPSHSAAWLTNGLDVYKSSNSPRRLLDGTRGSAWPHTAAVDASSLSGTSPNCSSDPSVRATATKPNRTARNPVRLRCGALVVGCGSSDLPMMVKGEAVRVHAERRHFFACGR